VDAAWITSTKAALDTELAAADTAVDAAHTVLMNDLRKSLAHRNAYQAAVDYRTSVATVRAELAWW
jgi:hypothetical protein